MPCPVCAYFAHPVSSEISIDSNSSTVCGSEIQVRSKADLSKLEKCHVRSDATQWAMTKCHFSHYPLPIYDAFTNRSKSWKLSNAPTEASSIYSRDLGSSRSLESRKDDITSDDEFGLSEKVNLVEWDGPDDPDNPQNWSKSRKWLALIVVSGFAFISPVSSSMIAPALEDISKSLGTTNTIETQFFLSIFLLAYAIGPVILGPLSETYGRVYVLQVTNLLYLFFNLACGFAQTTAQMLIFRFLAGLGGSAPLAIGGGVIGDMFTAEERGSAVAVYSLAPLLGPAIGPIIGGFIAESVSWRWIFYTTTIADFVIQIGGLFLLQETHPPTLLHRRCKRLRKETGNPHLTTAADTKDQSKIAVIGQAMKRPICLLGTQPIIQFLALYMAYVYGLMYLVLSTFPDLWVDLYHQATNIGSLHYLALGLGFFMGSQIAPRLNDKIYKRLKAQNNGEGRPEFRLLPVTFGSIAVPVGLLIYGWTAKYQVFWLVPDIGIFIFSVGTIVCFQCAQTYLIDAYTRYAASALAAVNVLRSLAGCGFPLFGPAMYTAIGYGWGGTLLALVSIGIGIPATWVLWRFGQSLRARSQFAAG